jgi:hypothetical protein
VIQARKACRAITLMLPAEGRRLDEIRARADRQHAWVLAGDPRSIYGDENAGATLRFALNHAIILPLQGDLRPPFSTVL